MDPTNSRQGGLVILPNPSTVRPGARPAHHAAPSAPEARTHPEVLQVLLVEDSLGDAKLVIHSLKTCRSPAFHITHVTTLAAAVAAVAGAPIFDVVLLDLNLPDSTSLDTISRMQAAAPRLPIVAMSGSENPIFDTHALEAGAQDYLVKDDAPQRVVPRAIRYAITRMNAQLERQLLAERLAAQQHSLMREVEAARAMQFDLLPRSKDFDERLRRDGLSVEAVFEPSSGIGGDLWGCIDCGDSRFAFYAFDFSGHGIGAALNVFRLHALIAEHWNPMSEPADILQSLGSVLPGLLARGQYATMVLCIIDCDQGVMEWASAGAPPPVMIENGRARFLESHGTPLGLVKWPTYQGHSAPFPPGSSLILYSDAITDAETSGDRYFGQDGLAELLKLELAELGEVRIGSLLRRFYGIVPPPLDDDLTAICITRLT